MQYKTHTFNLHFYPYLSASFVGRSCNMCFYANKSHNQNHCTTLCILVNVTEMLELKTHNHKNTHPYIKRQYSEIEIWQTVGCWKCCITYVTCAVGVCLICPPLGLCVHIRQIPPAHVTYITYHILQLV